MEKNLKSVLGKNQFMKKRFFAVATVLFVSTVFAQQKKLKEPPPPPAPPGVMDARPIPPPPPPPKVPDLPKDYKAFLQRNPTVKNLGWSKNKIHIYLKMGTEEVYQLDDREQMQELQDKYGNLPVAPPPPPEPPKAPKS
jgi:hypothetical protein